MSVVRNNFGSTLTVIKEHWTSSSKEELLTLFEEVEKTYPNANYGTSLYNIRRDPTGLIWHAEFYRYVSF